MLGVRRVSKSHGCQAGVKKHSNPTNEKITFLGFHRRGGSDPTIESTTKRRSNVTRRQGLVHTTMDRNTQLNLP